MNAWEGLSPPYRTIVADPPWHYDVQVSHLQGAARHLPMPYSSMTVDEVCRLPVGQLYGDDAWLFLWATDRYLPFAFEVLDSWGFEYRQTLVWRKVGCPTPFPAAVAPNHAEYLLVATCGRPGRRDWVPSSVIEAPRQSEHSRKPAAFLDAVEQIADGPYVELFARAPRLGWDSWGYGYETAAS